jgi:hypothetical protein
MIIKMRVSYEESERLVESIDHKSCKKAMKNHWIKEGHAGVTAQSICWLYCWAATGMGSAKAQRQAEAVFNTIFDKSTTHLTLILCMNMLRSIDIKVVTSKKNLLMLRQTR